MPRGHAGRRQPGGRWARASARDPRTSCWKSSARRLARGEGTQGYDCDAVAKGILASIAALLVALPADAAVAAPSPLGLTCTAQADTVRFCPGNGGTQR